MPLTDYTTYPEVRAVLGVAEEELEDEVLALPLYATLLEESIYSMATGLAAAYVLIKAIPEQDRDANQTRLINLVSAWAAYQVAYQLLTSVSMFAPKTIESDKDKQDRIVDPYAALRVAIPAHLAVLAGRILGLYGILFPLEPLPTLVTPINVVVVGLGTDPITG